QLPEVARAIDQAEARVRAKVPAARLIYLEPDLDRELSAESKSRGRRPAWLRAARCAEIPTRSRDPRQVAQPRRLLAVPPGRGGLRLLQARGDRHRAIPLRVHQVVAVPQD